MKERRKSSARNERREKEKMKRRMKREIERNKEKKEYKGSVFSKLGVFVLVLHLLIVSVFLMYFISFYSQA